MFLTEKLKAEKTLVFSADLCYNGANEKPPSRREPLDARNLRGMGFALRLCNTKAKLEINRTINKNLMEGHL